MAIFNLTGAGGDRRVKDIPLELIDRNPMQPRCLFDGKAIEELARSIKENGLISPIIVRKLNGRYQLIAGERRLMAFELLCEKTIPALIEQADDRKSAVWAMVENIQRRDLSFFEEARAIKTLIETQGLTQQQAADKLGISQSAVANKLRLLRLPTKARQAIIQNGLTERHARALLPLCEDERLEKVLSRVAEQQLNVAQTEKLVFDLLAGKKPIRRGGRILIVKDLRLFTSTISRAVDMMKQAGIDAVSKKTEDEDSITYTVVIPKRRQAEKNYIRSQTPPLREAL